MYQNRQNRITHHPPTHLRIWGINKATPEPLLHTQYKAIPDFYADTWILRNTFQAATPAPIPSRTWPLHLC